MRTILSLLGILALVPFLTAQPADKPDDALQRTQRLLDEELIESKHFRQEVPLAKFLTDLEARLPKEKKLSLRLDEDAFGGKAAEVAATPMLLPASPAKTTLRAVLEIALTRIKTKADYRIGPREVAITTPPRALYTARYDIRDLVEKPKLLGEPGEIGLD